MKNSEKQHFGFISPQIFHRDTCTLALVKEGLYIWRGNNVPCSIILTEIFQVSAIVSYTPSLLFLKDPVSVSLNGMTQFLFWNLTFLC